MEDEDILEPCPKGMFLCSVCSYPRHRTFCPMCVHLREVDEAGGYTAMRLEQERKRRAWNGEREFDY